MTISTFFYVSATSISSTINLALKEAKEAGIKGKDVTPFVLDKVNHLTGGKSLKTSMLLINLILMHLFRIN